MSYLDRLKQNVSENCANTEATKGTKGGAIVTKGAFDTFVASLPTPLRQISSANEVMPKSLPPEIRLLIDRVMRLRECTEMDREVFADDWRADPDGIEAGLRHLVNFYGSKP